MLEEFKKFALRGNVVDLAVGVIIGAAFGAIVNSAVQDIFMPVIGAITGGLDFSNYYIPLSSKVQAGLPYVDAKKQGAVLGYGQFLTLTLNFAIVAFVGQRRNPQLCFAVSTTCLAPKSSIDWTHWSVSSLVGLKCDGSLEQLRPYVAMLK